MYISRSLFLYQTFVCMRGIFSSGFPSQMLALPISLFFFLAQTIPTQFNKLTFPLCTCMKNYLYICTFQNPFHTKKTFVFMKGFALGFLSRCLHYQVSFSFLHKQQAQINMLKFPLYICIKNYICKLFILNKCCSK